MPIRSQFCRSGKLLLFFFLLLNKTNFLDVAQQEACVLRKFLDHSLDRRQQRKFIEEGEENSYFKHYLLGGYLKSSLNFSFFFFFCPQSVLLFTNISTSWLDFGVLLNQKLGFLFVCLFLRVESNLIQCAKVICEMYKFHFCNSGDLQIYKLSHKCKLDTFFPL